MKKSVESILNILIKLIVFIFLFLFRLKIHEIHTITWMPKTNIFCNSGWHENRGLLFVVDVVPGSQRHTFFPSRDIELWTQVPWSNDPIDSLQTYHEGQQPSDGYLQAKQNGNTEKCFTPRRVCSVANAHCVQLRSKLKTHFAIDAHAMEWSQVTPVKKALR